MRLRLVKQAQFLVQLRNKFAVFTVVQCKYITGLNKINLYIYFNRAVNFSEAYSCGAMGAYPPPPWVREIHSFHGRFWAPTDLEWPLIGWTFRYVHKILCISLRKFQFNHHYILLTLLYMIHE